MLGIVEKVKGIFCGDFVRQIIRREKSTQAHEETRNKIESEEQAQDCEEAAPD